MNELRRTDLRAQQVRTLTKGLAETAPSLYLYLSLTRRALVSRGGPQFLDFPSRTSDEIGSKVKQQSGEVEEKGESRTNLFLFARAGSITRRLNCKMIGIIKECFGHLRLNVG